MEKMLEGEREKLLAMEDALRARVVGQEDVLYEADKRLADKLSSLGVKLTFTPVPGMHEYKVWRKGLHDVAPELFVGVK